MAVFDAEGREAELQPREVAASHADQDLLHQRSGCRRPADSVLKRAFDLFFSSILFVLLAPVMAAIALVIWLGDGRSPVFVQDRLGRDGRPFRFYKFRSMREGAEERLQALLENDAEAAREWEETRKLRTDPRITTFGDVIRTWSLDELPQLINVLRGDMSLIGPRPIVCAADHELDDVRLYGADIIYYCQARPGLTGLWQVSGRANTRFEDRVALDVAYIRTWSLWADLKIALRTLPAVLLRRGAI